MHLKIQIVVHIKKRTVSENLTVVHLKINVMLAKAPAPLTGTVCLASSVAEVTVLINQGFAASTQLLHVQC